MTPEQTEARRRATLGFGVRLQIAMLKEKLTSKALAFALDVHVQTIYRYRRGLDFPTIVHLQNILKVLPNTNARELICGASNETDA